MWKYTQSVGDFFLFEVQECYVCQATDLFRKAHPQLVSIHPKIADLKKMIGNQIKHATLWIPT